LKKETQADAPRRRGCYKFNLRANLNIALARRRERVVKKELLIKAEEPPSIPAMQKNEANVNVE